MITFEEATFIQRIEIVVVSSGLALLVMTALWMRARRKRRDPVGCILPLVFVTACTPLLSLVVAKVRLLPYELEYDALIAQSFDHEGLRAVAPGVSPLRSESGAIRAAALQSSLLSTIEVLTDDHRPDAELREWLLSDFRSGREPTNGRAATAMLLAACGVLPEDDALVEAAWAALPVDAWISVDDGSLQLAASIPWSWWQARPCSGSDSASSAVDVKLVRLVAKDGREIEVVPFDGRDRRSKSGTAFALCSRSCRRSSETCRRFTSGGIRRMPSGTPRGRHT
jgi:hypothetical protein